MLLCTGRHVSGHEAITITVQAPSSTVAYLPVGLEDGMGRYHAALRCSEVRPVSAA